MSIVRTLRILASQRPTLPPRAVAAPSRVERRRPGSIPVTWIDRHLAGTATIVHLHGGAYVAGETKVHWEWLEEVGRRSGAATAMIHYRLAPTYPYPAAIEDVLRAIDTMAQDSQLRPGSWVLSGDSSGAGLALAVTQSLARAGRDTPALLLLESLWADLRPQIDAQGFLGTAARLYAGSVPVENPRLSPLLGDLGSLPPVHLVTGSEDMVVEDSRRLHAGITEAGGTVRYLEVPGEGHMVAVAGEGPAAQAARRTQIEAIHDAVAITAAT
ncbi:alpha/beta hydrolase [Brachybacterium sacelli]|uniref:Acetyl esterase/lipase n=1 Tax=Brachybacterium sacelli TaxID=173364 RepID=A0ABS4WYP9_9MICO|nr:alpha/beta hydrolase fold domain-containing protein [Brachybacterium sacelli]MBP2381113.1 acetyl esterase/lipase [Brachybacterium sacelli]